LVCFCKFPICQWNVDLIFVSIFEGNKVVPKTSVNMDFEKLTSTRYSVRKYSSKKVEDEKLETVLEAARKAPTAVNFQPFRLYVVREEKMRQQIIECYHRSWFASAPVIIVAVGLHDSAWKRGGDNKDHTDIDLAIAIDHLTLQATDLGLGTCWVCNFDTEKCRQSLKLRPSEEPIALIPLGYPDTDEIPVKKRKGLDELVVWI
jgi:nitroreductase